MYYRERGGLRGLGELYSPALLLVLFLEHTGTENGKLETKTQQSNENLILSTVVLIKALGLELSILFKYLCTLQLFEVRHRRMLFRLHPHKSIGSRTQSMVHWLDKEVPIQIGCLIE